MSSSALSTRRRSLMRADEFLEWLEPGKWADLINGQIYRHSPVSLRHARVLNFFGHLLAAYIRRKKLGELHRETVAVRLSSRNVFLPDLSFFTNQQTARLKETHAPFAPAFVLEALSPGSRERDLKPKFAAYEENGVDEYWVLDPQRLQHQFFQREGEFLAEVQPVRGRIDSSVILGFWVKTGWLTPEKLPDEDACLEEILGKRAGS